MANTTDLLITTLFDDDAVKFINEKTGLDFKQLTDGSRSGGPKILSFECFGTVRKDLDYNGIMSLIEVFESAPFDYPEYAILLVDDDNENFNGVARAII